ncbi:MAG: CDP-diacylglycerol--serine O-phosphatidyltransferase [Methanothrix sp.]|nr:CDP-diacylglycerol--serine O-phosphatidyltransferase [Methanothrix sp.]
MSILSMLQPADLLTLLNCALGFLAVLAAGKGLTHLGASLILLAVIVDGMDGHLARMSGPGRLGAALDSLADLVSFGVAPAFLAATSLGLPATALPAALIYLLCGALRLARFSLAPGGDRCFEGLPIPAAGIALASGALLGSQSLAVIFMLLLSPLMASSIPYPKIRDMRAMSLLGMALMASALLIMQQSFQAACFLIALIILYIASPVVIRCPREER